MSFFTRNHDHKTVTIPLNGTVSDPIDMRHFAMLTVTVPSGWTTADIGFTHAVGKNGPYSPARDDGGNLLEISSPTAGGSHVAPAEIAALGFVKLWSQSSGTGVPQLTSAKELTVMLKA